jgi:hypothetical protein
MSGLLFWTIYYVPAPCFKEPYTKLLVRDIITAGRRNMGKRPGEAGRLDFVRAQAWKNSAN